MNHRIKAKLAETTAMIQLPPASSRFLSCSTTRKMMSMNPLLEPYNPNTFARPIHQMEGFE